MDGSNTEKNKVAQKSAASKAKLVGLVGFGLGALATGLVSVWATSNRGTSTNTALTNL